MGTGLTQHYPLPHHEIHSLTLFRKDIHGVNLYQSESNQERETMWQLEQEKFNMKN